jgi:hypothetical protein
MNRVLAAITFFIVVMNFQPCLGQDVLGTQKVNALKGLRSIAIVIRPNTPREVATLKEWSDMIEVGLHRNVPGLAVSGTEKSPNWLELSIVTTDAGGLIEISLYRWVKILASGEEVFAKVWWDSQAIFGGVSKQALQQSLDALLTSFAADYLLANR